MQGWAPALVPILALVTQIEGEVRAILICKRSEDRHLVKLLRSAKNYVQRLYIPTIISLFLAPICTHTALAAPSPQNTALARRFAPQWRFHKDEMYFPSSVEWFLSQVKQVDDNGSLINANPTVQTLDGPTGQGSGLYLTTDIDANRDGWLKGVNPLQDPFNVAVYTFVAPKANGVTDIYYWLFTPFNEAKDVPVLGRVGDHVGDWERLTVRTVNGEATQVDYHAHSDTGSTVPFSEAPKFDGDLRPVGYIAKGSHGIWETAGTHTYVDAVIFKLQDLTSEDGVYWDTRESLVIYNFPDLFSGSDAWLNYKGVYGNKGTTDCWWYVFHKECKVVTGPPGPYRTDVMGVNFKDSTSELEAQDPSKWDMKGPLSQVLGLTTDADHSTFTIYLNLETSETFIGLKVTCSSTDQEAPSDQFHFVVTPAGLNLQGNKITITSPACPPNTKITAYNVGLCTESSSCQWARSRALKAYSKDGNANGAQETRAIAVEDLDVWEF
ncbi:hypothetical protein V5O48_008801 [Marasmius crinis-equi]|uniref:Vacuolar protein sorting-associated protein 62 n=1 Tax=Marasmius crinis-equi TaxID=585013 RepID=A0ABR3FDK3_9AGAR